MKCNNMEGLRFSRIMVFASMFFLLINAYSQSIKVLDKEGRGIPSAIVLSKEGYLIGTTNLSGYLNNIKGRKEVLVTHMAYKPQLVLVNPSEDNTITMEDVDYSLPKLENQSNSYLYAEIYYRSYLYYDGMLYNYISGVMPFGYDLGSRATLSDCRTVGKDFLQIISRDYVGEYIMEKKKYPKKFLNMNFLPIMLTIPTLLEDKDELISYNLTKKNVSNRQSVISNRTSPIGVITKGTDQSLFSIDMYALIKSVCRAKGENIFEKLLTGESVEMQYVALSDNRQDVITDIRDLKMFSNSYVVVDRGDKFYFIVEAYVSERNCMHPKEFKEKRRETERLYKAPMSLDESERYAAKHNIPTLSPMLRHIVNNPHQMKLRNVIYL